MGSSEVEAWLARAARTRPEFEAVNGVGYSALRERALAGARGLVARGVGPGDRVGIALPAGVEWVVALHATWSTGAVAVPIDSRDPSPPAVDIRVDEPLTDGPAAPLLAAHDLSAVAVVIHTSGSTGTPKPVGLTFGNLLWSALGSGAALGVDPRERWLCPLPLTHVGGLSIVVRSAIYATTARVLDRWDTDAVLAELRDDATLVSLVPTTLRRLLAAGLAGEDVPALRTVLLGGAPIPPELLSCGVPVTGTYGLTEACSQVTTGGPALFCTRVRIAPDGEIVVSGPTVAPQTGGELLTGDLGRLDDEGALHVIGRKADTIVTGGENVAPAEVEAVLEAHPAVREAAVLGVSDPEWGERVVALVVGAVSEAELRDHARAALAPFKAPKKIRFVAELPRTASGKLRRGALYTLYEH